MVVNFMLPITYMPGAQRALAVNAGIITLSIPVLVAICASIMLNEKLSANAAAILTSSRRRPEA